MPVKERLEDDLFQDTVMTFGEHLEELRICLWRALIGLVVGFLLGLTVAHLVVRLIQVPLTGALERFYQKQSKQRLTEEIARAGGAPSYSDDDVVQLIDEEQLTFERVYIDWRELAGQLREQDPQHPGLAQLPKNPAGHRVSRFGPSRVVAADFGKDPRAFARQAVKAADAAAPSAAKHVWGLLDDAQRARLREIARQEKQPTAAEAEALAGELAAMLDPLLDEPIYDEQAFAKVKLPPEAEELRSLKERSKQEQRRLNRLVLEAAFPGAVAATHREMLPLTLWRPVEENTRVRPTALSAQEVFGIWIKAALLVGALISSPWVFYQIWTFVAAGLYRHEKRYVHIFLPFSLGLFLAGAALAGGFVFQPVLDFLFTYNAWMGIDPDPRISEWLSFVLILPLGFGISFQLPLVMLFLERIGIFSVSTYTANWRISVLVIFVVAMVLTPADPYSMLLMAVPLVGLYVLGIGLCKWMPRGRLFAPAD
jgi:sec-independent protein translocase protein TatC